MNSLALMTESLSPDLLARMKVHAGSSAWAIRDIPAVIEACRTAKLTSQGGDLQIQTSDGLWESPNFGVTVFEDELSLANEAFVEQAAIIASRKFTGLDKADMLAEVIGGCPGAAAWSRDEILSRLHFSWSVAALACSPPLIA